MPEKFPDTGYMLGRASVVGAVLAGSLVTSTEQTREPMPEIYIQRPELYDTPDVDDIMPYVVAVNGISRSTGKALNSGTGVLINGHILTAGHVYEPDKNVSLGDTCKYAFSATRDKDIDVNDKNLEEFALPSLAAESYRQGQDLDLSKSDWALFKAETTEGLHNTIISEHQPEPGSVVTFTNYQAVQSTTGGGEVQFRHPALKNISYDDPAIFKGLIIGQNETERTAILTAIDPSTTFSNPGDNTLIGGGSGGPVWNEAGELVGLSNNKHKTPMNAQEISEAFNVRIIGANADQKFRIDWMQPIKRSDLVRLHNHLQSCDFDEQDLNALRDKQDFTFE